ncbi:MAG: hypothetical protein AAGA60_30390 [Cyanobacteria bacterium P01_E01_bin.42]
MLPDTSNKTMEVWKRPRFQPWQFFLGGSSSSYLEIGTRHWYGKQAKGLSANLGSFLGSLHRCDRCGASNTS